MASLRACRSFLLERHCDSLRSSTSSKELPTLLMEDFQCGEELKLLGPRGSPVRPQGSIMSSIVSDTRPLPSEASLLRTASSVGSGVSRGRSSSRGSQRTRKKRDLRFGPPPKTAEYPAPNAYSPEASFRSTGGCSRSPQWTMPDRNPRGGSFDMHGVNVHVAPWSYNLPSALNIFPRRPQGSPLGGQRFPRIPGRSPGPCAYSPADMRKTVNGPWDRGIRQGVTLPEDDYTPSPCTYNNRLPPSSPKAATISRAGLVRRRESLVEGRTARVEKQLAAPGSTLNLRSGRSFGRAKPVRGIPITMSGAGDLGPGTYGSFLRHYAVGKLKSVTSCQGRNPPGTRWMDSCLDSESDGDDEIDFDRDT
ncbi:hypothetical protein FOZ63_007237 [Perkinsus olseni]|uniref:Uncharacterized protein n=1 Tax=Perkinsus olseni TaxID=32597 RepID=A0A7J6NY24_PEROL|nr:hypothetical protein FOZ60_002392 [Perkinsus olseni]KAF4754638.1 hypothetical protein FOZ63_007237 [Perkinsus olseni]